MVFTFLLRLAQRQGSQEAGGVRAGRSAEEKI